MLPPRAASLDDAPMAAPPPRASPFLRWDNPPAAAPPERPSAHLQDASGLGERWFSATGGGGSRLNEIFQMTTLSPGFARLPDTDPDEDGDGPVAGAEEDLFILHEDTDWNDDRRATQRTNWAWLRTSISLISLGLTILSQFLSHRIALFALVTLALGLVYAALALIRFYITLRYFEAGRFLTNSKAVATASVVTLFAMLGILVLMIVT
ncbi:hypothetical protein H696_04051 [Fonticula alba]|uniref:DUF202 domain-containing protein n=1 Tax=Fonticula alba TaxID=691883 RepID=A0A058Z6S5_FONAL|nr:hypothetical protein H696_04051 [Fonticula alba]KCV69633.1 hypothetical protein H696_04051 [Fonticula alba]|eukprot:XP_009496198.1 hypothetical protein H696_04051 [Fonticula alba]